jgi:hypothetical protein
MIVTAAAYDIPACRLSLWLFKGTITCGNCGCTFTAKIPFTVMPTVPCPHCGVLNRLNVAPERLQQ